MRSLDCIVQPDIDPFRSVATDLHLMGEVAASSGQRGALRIYSFPADVLCLGRYHLAPEEAPPDRPTLCRRLSGGRVLPLGDGFVGVSLILPHRSALVAPEPFALAPHQVLNRYVRGLLEACRLLHLPVIYPGRDLVTINRRATAAVSFETDARGVLLFEAFLAVGRDFALTPTFLDAVDRDGVVKVDLLAPEQVTCLSRELQTALSFTGVVDKLREGYARQFRLGIESRELNAGEENAVAASVSDLGREWVTSRRRDPQLDRHGIVWSQLGAFEAYLALAADSTIRAVRFAGDFIANSPSIEKLEQGLRSCASDPDSIRAVVERLFSQPENYLLGIGRLDTVADTIVQGLRG